MSRLHLSVCGYNFGAGSPHEDQAFDITAEFANVLVVVVYFYKSEHLLCRDNMQLSTHLLLRAAVLAV